METQPEWDGQWWGMEFRRGFKWVWVHPSGNPTPYRYKSKEEAERMLWMLYPDIVREQNQSGDVVVRASVLEDATWEQVYMGEPRRRVMDAMLALAFLATYRSEAFDRSGPCYPIRSGEMMPYPDRISECAVYAYSQYREALHLASKLEVFSSDSWNRSKIEANELLRSVRWESAEMSRLIQEATRVIGGRI